MADTQDFAHLIVVILLVSSFYLFTTLAITIELVYFLVSTSHCKKVPITQPTASQFLIYNFLFY